LITQGYVGFFRRVVEVIQRLIPVGRSHKRKEEDRYEELTLYAKLVEVNGKSPVKKVEGRVIIRVERSKKFVVSITEHVSTKVRRLWSDIVITVKRMGGGS
jgi:hypothetical protein